jgi:molybdopterin molybdotransferase
MHATKSVSTIIADSDYDPNSMPVAKARAYIRAFLAPVAAIERLNIRAALGRVLGEDIRSTMNVPAHDNSAMDGYAVRTAEVADAPVTLPVAFDIPAGRTDVPALPDGAAARIMTGAPVPAGADAIVPVEQTDGGTETVAIKAVPFVGAHVRRTAEDVQVGDVVLTAGTVLGPAQIGVAAAVGHARLPVRRRPVVLVLSTGSELVAPGAPLAPGQIYESNGPMLAAAVEEAGARAELLRFVPDDVAQFLAVLGERAAGVDLVVTSGGVSAGAYEVVKDALADRGVTFGKVAMQPGGPQGAGRLDGGVPVVTLPGNPVSALVSFEVFVRPVLRSAFGHPYPERPVVVARLAQAVTSPSGRRQFRRGVLDARNGTVAEVGGPPSHLLGALAKADCLFVVPEATTELVAGAEVAVWLLDG